MQAELVNIVVIYVRDGNSLVVFLSVSYIFHVHLNIFVTVISTCHCFFLLVARIYTLLTNFLFIGTADNHSASQLSIYRKKGVKNTGWNWK